jgi:hypothetical protein
VAFLQEVQEMVTAIDWTEVKNASGTRSSNVSGSPRTKVNIILKSKSLHSYFSLLMLTFANTQDFFDILQFSLKLHTLSFSLRYISLSQFAWTCVSLSSWNFWSRIVIIHSPFSIFVSKSSSKCTWKGFQVTNLYRLRCIN